jgi:hypothetical protein
MIDMPADPDEQTYAQWLSWQPPILTLRTLRVNYVIAQVCMTIITWGLWLPLVPVKHVLWYNNCLDIYKDRIVRRMGRWHRESETIALRRVTDVAVVKHAGWPNRGYITIESAGRHSGIRFGMIRDPEGVRDLILSLRDSP